MPSHVSYQSSTYYQNMMYLKLQVHSDVRNKDGVILEPTESGTAGDVKQTVDDDDSEVRDQFLKLTFK